jgi:hypothetical protein
MQPTLIRDLATDPEKRALFTRLADHLATLSSEVEAAIAAKILEPTKMNQLLGKKLCGGSGTNVPFETRFCAVL